MHATFEVSVEHLEVLRSNGAEDASDALDLLNLLAFTHYKGQFELIPGRAAEYALYLLQREDSADDGRDWILSPFHAVQLPQYSPRAADGAKGKLRWRRAYQRLRAFSLVSAQDGVGARVLSIHPLVY